MYGRKVLTLLLIFVAMIILSHNAEWDIWAFAFVSRCEAATTSSLVKQENILLNGTTKEMLKPEFWISRLNNPDEIIADSSQIERLNSVMHSAVSKDWKDLESISNVEEIPSCKFVIFEFPVIVEDRVFDPVVFLKYFNKNRVKYKVLQYAITVRRTAVLRWPTAKILKYPTDMMEENVTYSSILEINSPFVIKESCKIDGKYYYYGQSEYNTGWIAGKDLAICSSREQWLEAWKVKNGDSNFIVFIKNHVKLDPIFLEPGMPEIEFGTGTVLKMASKFSRQKSGNLFILPARDRNGRYVQKVINIPTDDSFCVGYMPFTKSNLLNISFRQLGDKIESNGVEACIGDDFLTRQIYNCFGLKLPDGIARKSESNFCQKVPKEKTSDDIQKWISQFTAGSIFFAEDFGAIYVGTNNGVSYGIIGVHTISEDQTKSNEKTKVGMKIHNTRIVILIPLNSIVYQKDKWMDKLTSVLDFGKL